MLLSRELPSCSVPLSSSPLPSPQPPSRQALLLRTFEGELLFSEGFGVWVWNVLAPASTQSCPRGRPGAWEQDRGGCDAPLVGHFWNFHPSEMFSPGRERKVELSLSLTPSLLRPVSSAVGWRALTQLRPLAQDSLGPVGPRVHGGIHTPKTRTLSMWLQLVVDGEHTVRGTEGSRVRSLADLSPDWEATVGSAGGDREGQSSGTRHRPHAGQERPGRWPRGLTGPRLGQKQQGGGLGRVAGISAPTCIIKKKIQMNVSRSSL